MSTSGIEENLKTNERNQFADSMYEMAFQANVSSIISHEEYKKILQSLIEIDPLVGVN